MNFFEFNKQFPTELACIEYFIAIRYDNGVPCRHCNNSRIYQKEAVVLRKRLLSFVLIELLNQYLLNS